jgi:cytochrome P450
VAAQTALVAELREVFDGDDRAATAQYIANLHGLRRVLKETMRLFPPVAFQTR